MLEGKSFKFSNCIRGNVSAVAYSSLLQLDSKFTGGFLAFILSFPVSDRDFLSWKMQDWSEMRQMPQPEHPRIRSGFTFGRMLQRASGAIGRKERKEPRDRGTEECGKPRRASGMQVASSALTISRVLSFRVLSTVLRRQDFLNYVWWPFTSFQQFTHWLYRTFQFCSKSKFHLLMTLNHPCFPFIFEGST